MKVFIASFMSETNSFSPIPAGESAFAGGMYFGDATKNSRNIASIPLHVWRDEVEADGGEIVESICAYAGAVGLVSKSFYEKTRDHLLADLTATAPFDIVLLHLHGSMVAHGYDDCEGDIIEKVREIVGGKCIIGVELDLHCALSLSMTDNSDIIITYKENPHIDIEARAKELYPLCKATALGEIKPVMNIQETHVIGTWNSQVEPLASIVRDAKDCEKQEDVLSVSFAHCFAMCDVADSGGKIIAITDDDEEKAERIAKEFAKKIWDARHTAVWTAEEIDKTMSDVLASPNQCIILSDYCDNAGGGAPSDSTFVLQRILDDKISDIANGLYWDPVAVEFCMDAGEGATLDLRIGGKACRQSGDPVDVTVKVMGIIKNASQPFGDASAVLIGDAVWVQAANNVDIVLSSLRQQVFDPELFTQFGIDLSSKKLIIVKSAIHFRAGFSSIASEIRYIRTEGLLGIHYAKIPFKKYIKNYWPKSENLEFNNA